jgi:predicted adenine nucleotide alpha hydrolase (AANH) superfamily ATPase/VanZ family protein
MKKLAKLYLVLCWAFFIFALLSASMRRTDDLSEITFYDKGIHFILFGILSFLIILAGMEFKKIDFKIAAFIGFFLSFFYALACEYFQKFVPGREASIWDLLAGIIGTVFAVAYAFFMFHKPRPKILIHVCCVGCGVYVSRELKNDYRPILYFYNPNIYPETEYQKRLQEAEKIAKKFKLKIIAEKYNHKLWLKKIKGRENDPERGERCLICYKDRLEATAIKAQEINFPFFTTTLTTSPHKDAKAIIKIGEKIGEKYKVNFLGKDFKKQNGFKKSACLAKELGLYRQNYCGCEFSRRF